MDTDVQNSSMKIKALAPWFGGKRNLAPWIVQELGEHRAYWEPFCGSMAVLMTKPRCTNETVNDLHGDLINLARVIKDRVRGPQLYRRLRRTLMSEDELLKAVEVMRQLKGPDVMYMFEWDRAYYYFIQAWMGRNGSAGTPIYNTATMAVRYTTGGGQGAQRWRSAVDSIPAWRRRLRSVNILHRDGFEILDRIEDAAGTAIYLDPPYFKKGAKYCHDFSQDDHDRLAAAVLRFKKARVVISYYEHPELDRLYEGWTRVHKEVQRSLSNSGQRGRKVNKATEVLLINGASNTAGKTELF